MLQYYNQLKPLISHFTIEHFMQYKGFDKKEVTGIYCSVTSLVRKNYSLQRIETLIRKHNLPLAIDEQDLINTNMFKIKGI